MRDINELTDVWAKYSTIAYRNKKRVMYGRRHFTVNERSYIRLFQALKEQKTFHAALDVGCGGGTNIDYLLSLNVTQHVTGVDSSEGALRGARDALSDSISQGRAELILCDFADLKLDRKFDLVVAIQVINYFHDLNFFFEAITNFVSEGGYIIVVDVQKDQSSLALSIDRVKRNPIIRKLFNKKPFEENPTLTFHDSKDIRAHASNHNLTLVQGHLGGHFISKLLGGIMYRIAIKEFKTYLARDISKLIYIFLRGVIELENLVFYNRPTGTIHFSIFSKNDFGAD